MSQHSEWQQWRLAALQQDDCRQVPNVLEHQSSWTKLQLMRISGVTVCNEASKVKMESVRGVVDLAGPQVCKEAQAGAGKQQPACASPDAP